MMPTLKSRWFRRWWFFVPLGVGFFLLAQANVVLSFPFFVLYMAIMWSGPIYRLSKPAPKVLKRRDKVILTGLSIVVIVFALVRQGSDAPLSTGVTDLPSCDSKTAVTTFKQAVKGSPQGRMIGLEVYELTDITESAWDPVAQIRNCHARALANSGRRPVEYTMTWVDWQKGRFWIETRL